MGILEGKRILVAGVTMDSSIGFAVARIAQEQGATVLISNFGRALGITRRIAKRLPVEPPVLELDVTDEDHLAGLEAQVREHVDGLDGVVHSIAYGNPETLLGGKFLTGPWPDVAQAVQVSAYSLKSLAEAARPLMGPGGSIINSSSVNSDNPSPNLIAYAMTKAGIANFTASLAQMLAEKGIRANSVAPGPIWTPLIPATMPDDKVESFGSQVPLGRAGQPAELAPVYVLLASDEASYVSGARVAVTGGKPIL